MLKTNPTLRSTLLWPLWLRLSHWLVAAGVLALWLLSHVWYETGVWHRGIGYALVAVILCRILAGLLTKHAAARFTLPHWRAIALHLQHLRSGKLPVQYGHNPLGQYAVYLLWSVILLLALTGVLSRTDAFWGEDWPVALHALLSWLLMGIVVMHVLAVGYVGRRSGQALVKQMLDGQVHVDERQKAIGRR